MTAYRQTSPYWREAATLIVAAPCASPTTGPTPGPIAGPGISHTDANNDQFEVLMLKRDAASSFMPNAFVYPGGVKSSHDFDRKRWEKIFQQNASLSVETVERMLRVPGERPAMLLPNSEDDDRDQLSADVGFRICALRETFEESGILLVTRGEDFKSGRSPRSRTEQPPMSALPGDLDVRAWRQKVSADAEQFAVLCEQFHVLPNVWSLYEWSNWLTPVTRKVDKPPPKPKRFDTMFYLCCLDKPLDGAEACSEETTEAHWKTPLSWRSGYLDKTFSMFGPQIYETSRLTSFTSKTTLVTYIQQREPLGMIRYFPVVFVINDGILFVLPGDERYPTDPDVDGVRDIATIPEDLASIMTSRPDSRFHRAGRDERRYLTTITLPCGLLSVQPDGTRVDPMAVLRLATAKL